MTFPRLALRASRVVWCCTLVAAVLLLATSISAQEAEAPVPAEEAEAPEPAGGEPLQSPNPGSTEGGSSAAPLLDPEDLEAALEAAEPTDDMEEIVVSGIRREKLLQDIPIAVTTFNASQLQDLRIQNIQDLSNYTPNLEINTAFAASNPTLFIRGIGLKDYNANAAGAVAVYQDGVALNSPAGQLFQMFDVQSVEVLRGPQGSTNGRNATAGAILVNSFKPDGEFSTRSDFTYGNYNTLQANGALGFPILDEVLAGRIAFTANFADGYVKNACAGLRPGEIVLGTPCFFSDKQAPPTIKQDPNWYLGLQDHQNDTRNWATRGMLRYWPTESQDWLLKFHWGQNRSDSFHLQSCGTNRWDDSTTLEKPGGGIFTVNVGSFRARQECLGQNVLNWKRPGSGDFDEIEVPGKFEPGELREFLDSLSPYFVSVPADDPFTGYYDSDGKEHLDVLGGSVTGNIDFGHVPFLGATRLVSITGYEQNERSVEDEGDGSPARIFAGLYQDRAWQVSQELLFQGAGERYSWTGGIYFLHEQLAADNFFAAKRDSEFHQVFDQTLWNGAPFASLLVDLIEDPRPGLHQLSLRAGVRYNWEKKDFNLKTDIISIGAGGDPTKSVRVAEAQGATWTGFTGDFTLSYSPVESLTTYAKYSRGMKGGHFNAGATTEDASIEPVNPEFVDAFELGWKGNVFDGRLQFRAALFYYLYQDLQVFDIVNEQGAAATQQLLNSDAKVLGAELEIEARPLSGLLVRFGGGWLKTEFVDFIVCKAARPPPFRPGARGEEVFCGDTGSIRKFDYSGNPLIAAPRWNASGMIEYEHPLPGEWGSIVPQFNFSWRSRQFFDPSGARFGFQNQEKLAPGVLSQEAYWLLNARLAYRFELPPGGSVEVAAWVDNMLEEVYLVDAFDLHQNFSTVLQVMGKPRTFGLTLSYRF